MAEAGVTSGLAYADDERARPQLYQLLQEWERQQAGYLFDREQRFQIMLDVSVVLYKRYTRPLDVLDLGCGPGSFAWRLLDALPDSRVYAIDRDPVLLEIGRLLSLNRRQQIVWLAGDLCDEQVGGMRAFTSASFDIIVSSTALHWLSPDSLVRVYEEAHRLLRPGGCLLNADRFPPRRETPLDRLSSEVRARAHNRARVDGLDWRSWWARAKQLPELQSVVTAQIDGVPGHNDSDKNTPTFGFHRECLLQAGFQDVALIWQWGESGVLCALQEGAPDNERDRVRA